MLASWIAFTVLWFTTLSLASAEYYVTIEDNGPIVYGASITFTAKLFTSYHSVPPTSGTFSFRWRDNAIPPHSAEFHGEITQSVWNVTYPKHEYVPGLYEVEVDVYKEFFIMYPICSHREFFNITTYLNGKMNIAQKNSTIDSAFVSTAEPVQHMITFHQPDYDYLKNNASSILTYWFVDCVYYGNTTDFNFYYNYTIAKKKHEIDAIVVASHVPLPPPTTTTAVPTTTTTNSTTTVKSSAVNSVEYDKLNSDKYNLTNLTDETMADKLSNNTDVSTTMAYALLTKDEYNNHSSSKLDTANSNEISNLNDPSELIYTVFSDSDLSKRFSHKTYINVPFHCANKSVILDPNKTYGFFSRTITPKDPVSDVKADGNFWLQHGDLLGVTVTCNGTGPFSYCVWFSNGIYNVTGNENCSINYSIPSCEFSVYRYLSDSIQYTLVVIINNDVGKVIYPIGINVYEVTKHPQLSVIIVPVAASIVAVILIIFGVAFYIQSKRRYTIEVADFDFSHLGDMEYKTFQERLLESISNAFNKEEEYSEQDSTSPAPSSRKYGSMQ